MGKLWRAFWRLQVFFALVGVAAAIVFWFFVWIAPLLDTNAAIRDAGIYLFLASISILVLVMAVRIGKKLMPRIKKVLSFVWGTSLLTVSRLISAVSGSKNFLRERAATNQLMHYKKLLDTGLISEQEFSKERERLKVVIRRPK